MELATALVALGSDKGNTVPRYDVTPAEIVVLQRIHGGDAVLDIDPTGTVERSFSAEYQRLAAIYAGAKTEDNAPVLQDVFPGRAPALPTHFDQLGLPAELYKPTARAKPAAEPVPEEITEPVSEARPARSTRKKADPAPVPDFTALAAAPAVNDVTDDVFAED